MRPGPSRKVFWVQRALSNMCNIPHVKATECGNFLLKNINYLLKKNDLLKRYIFNIKCISFNASICS